MVDSLIGNNRVLHMNYTQVISGAYRYKRIVIKFVRLFLILKLLIIIILLFILYPT